MTFDQVVDEVMERLNLTSLDARERVGRRVNTRYRKVVSSVGMQTSQRISTSVLCHGLTDTDLPVVVVPFIEKIYRITMSISGGVRVLKEKSFDEIDNVATVTGGYPTAWAVKTLGPSEVTIKLDAYPAVDFTLIVEGYDKVIDMEGSQEPFFPEDFHDILVEGAMSDELRKMEKPALAQIAENSYLQRLSDLRFFIAKSGYTDIAQGKNRPGQTWYRPWYTRSGLYN